jgi:hypothetical protein
MGTGEIKMTKDQAAQGRSPMPDGSYEDVDELDQMVAVMREHLRGADPMNPVTTDVFTAWLQRIADAMPESAVPMLTLILARKRTTLGDGMEQNSNA